MVAVLDRSGAPPPADAAECEEYSCSCAGFREKVVVKMCLRCLDAYSDGLEEAGLEPAIVQREMERVATRLAVLLADDPLIANLPVEHVLRRAG